MPIIKFHALTVVSKLYLWRWVSECRRTHVNYCFRIIWICGDHETLGVPRQVYSFFRYSIEGHGVSGQFDGLTARWPHKNNLDILMRNDTLSWTRDRSLGMLSVMFPTHWLPLSVDVICSCFSQPSVRPARSEQRTATYHAIFERQRITFLHWYPCVSIYLIVWFCEFHYYKYLDL